MEDAANAQNWVDLGNINLFEDGKIKEVVVYKTRLAVTRNGKVSV